MSVLKVTSYIQINKQKQKHKTDYENLLLLQRIQNVRPSKEIAASLSNLKIKSSY